ncbi:MAG: Fic family protein [Nanoarchaeota archaeon]|nr:Fic family protein [Nanoarchaeota archaeon]MBU1632550.1 Fic family protein [Nanoarchaeota archaeon]MBU1875678.1 Fic family protein [Nanoarchaeota archaeon]
MNILSNEFLEKIEEAKSKLDERKLELIVEQMFTNLVQESIYYASIQDDDNEKRKEEVVKNFKEAWSLGKRNYEGEFNLLLLTDIAGKIEPSLKELGKKFASLRNQRASLKNMNYCPPADQMRIRRDLENVLKTIQENELHPVEEAVFLYFHLVRIQPFENGNKRTASAVMNLTLSHNGFPTVYVSPHEKSTYISLLNSAIKGFSEQSASFEKDSLDNYKNLDYQQKGFYEYMAKKVLDSLVYAEDKLKRLSKYNIIMQTNNPGEIYTLKKMISSWFNKRNAIHQIHLNRRDSYVTVIGNIPYEVLDCILEKIPGDKKRKYTLSTIEESCEAGPLSRRPPKL